MLWPRWAPPNPLAGQYYKPGDKLCFLFRPDGTFEIAEARFARTQVHLVQGRYTYDLSQTPAHLDLSPPGRPTARMIFEPLSDGGLRLEGDSTRRPDKFSTNAIEIKRFHGCFGRIGDHQETTDFNRGTSQLGGASSSS